MLLHIGLARVNLQPLASVQHLWKLCTPDALLRASAKEFAASKAEYHGPPPTRRPTVEKPIQTAPCSNSFGGQYLWNTLVRFLPFQNEAGPGWRNADCA